MRKIFVWMACLTLFAVTGCVSVPIVTHDSLGPIVKIHYAPSRVFSAPADQVWDTLMDVLEKRKDPILAIDSENGVVQTDWVVEWWFLRLSPVTRYRLNIQVIPLSDLESEVVVRIQEERHAGGDDWEYILPTEKKASQIFRSIRWRLKCKTRP